MAILFVRTTADDAGDGVHDRPTDDQAPLARAGLRAVRPPFSALTWAEDNDAGNVRSDLRWGPTPDPRWLVQLSFVVAAAGVTTEEFEVRYRSHVEVARRHHPGIVRYVQHVATAPEGLSIDPPAPIDPGAVRAISELWFIDEGTLESRYWADATSRDAVREDNAPYVDFSRSWSVLCRRQGDRLDLGLGARTEAAR